MALIFGMAYAVFLTSAASQKAYKRLVDNPNGQWAFQSIRTDQFLDDWIITETENGFYSRVPLSLINKVEVIKGCVVLAFGSQKLIVPIRVFGSPADRKEIAEFFAAKGLIKSDKMKLALEQGA